MTKKSKWVLASVLAFIVLAVIVIQPWAWYSCGGEPIPDAISNRPPGAPSGTCKP